MNLELIERIQPDIFCKLSSEAFFAPISLFAIREHRFISEIEQALSSAGLNTADPNQAGKLPGLTIEVLMPMLLDAAVNAPGPEVTIEQKIIIKENPTINLAAGGTGISAEYCGTTALRTLHHFGLVYGPASILTFYPAPNCLSPNHDFPDLVAYDLVMRGRINFGSLQTTPNPIARGNGLQISLSMPPGPAGNPTLWNAAAIYYTLDGTFPGPGITAAASLTGTAAASTAQLYQGAFNVAVGTVVRYAAYMPAGSGFAGSGVNWIYINPA